MKCDVIDDNNFLIKVYSEYLDFDIYDHDEIRNFIEKIYDKLLSKYYVCGSLVFNIFLDRMYGMIIEVKKNGDFIFKNLLDVKIKFNLNISFLYEVDYFYILENEISNQNIYYYKGKYYLELIRDIDKKKYIELLDNCNIIYNEEINNIVNNGIKLSYIKI